VAEIAVRPRGPYSLALSTRLAGDATRRVRDGVLTARCGGGVARAWQSRDGTVRIRSESSAAAEKLRWMLALDDDHSEFLRRVADDPLLGRASLFLRGLRPMRTATVGQALLRAVCGQLIDSKTARSLERRVIRRLAPRDENGLCEPPTTSALGATAPFELRRLGLHERRGAAVVRLCRSLELERLHDFPTEAVVRRLERERGLGPWSAALVASEGLGRWERGLVGDLNLFKLCRVLHGREATLEDTEALLARYGDYGALAFAYLVKGWSRGLLPLASRAAA
jgi:3-methyladenine DNA glycosylase/8-oxoguanine DNA glycosylase